MAFADELEYENITKVFLAEITASQQLTHWILNSGTTYYASTTYNVTDLKEDGVSLTSKSSIAQVDAAAGSYYFDNANDRVYVHATGSVNPHTLTYISTLQFYFGSHPKIFNDNYYEPLLTSAPNLSLRIQSRFSGIGQIGGGNIRFVNTDGYFDNLSTLQWNGGTAIVKVGVDRPGQTEMIYSDYSTVGTWRVVDWVIDDQKFTVKVIEDKIDIKRKIPYSFYDRDTYPLMFEDDVGKPIQIAYGLIKDAKPVSIDVTLAKFKVAGHSVVSFDGVRVKNETTGAWDTVTFLSTDTANAQFRLSSSDWDSDKEVAVDFTGKLKSGAIPMDNPADIVKDIIETYMLKPAGKVDSASFTTAYNILDRGIFELTRNKRATESRLGIYIDATETIESILSSINFVTGSYLYANSEGKYFYRVFQPAVGEGLDEYDDKIIESFSEVTDNTNLISKVQVNYNRRLIQEWTESSVFELSEVQYVNGLEAPAIKEYEVPLSDQGDADRLASRQVNYEGQPEKIITITVPARNAMTKLPGDFVRVVYTRHNIDGTFEVLGINNNLLSGKTTLTLGDNHGLTDRSGWWVADSPTGVLPTRFANLAGYGTGSLDWNSSWDNEIKEWVRQNVGYWTDDNDFANAADPDSYIASTYI